MTNRFLDSDAGWWALSAGLATIGADVSLWVQPIAGALAPVTEMGVTGTGAGWSLRARLP
ncbi:MULTISPECIES: hypothetical protein [Rhodococcus]|uniref:hypothetical protein n=1 Tax=Rhodococcus TaxID=1827 RepID=UPI0029548884|nr:MULTISPECIES: hypothetical protein [Rhodococcus]MDV7242266.1 hypothetical protein [Rhodococcus oxybenzonivorans]MDV7276238.1 hypothetical protein [Rhodococcus oxybenzonivorans]MDV7331754.1 hypothetical protein [Rhodococcus oxybenzonivorans]MDV7343976.1 hypothetical protein [Rhodococcus oxybenzonivorans]MDV8029895.1 hypothetical protein [Rhodococcus sp. IEGM 27]